MTKDQLEVLFETWRKGAAPRPDAGTSPHTTHHPRSESGDTLVSTKNTDTHNRYTELTHIFQNLTYAMQEDGHTLAHPLSPALIASLVWHVPNHALLEDTYFDAVKDSILYLHTQTRSAERCATWTDISTGLPLFDPNPLGTREDVHLYLVEAWQCLGFSKTFLG
jgi:hypothetical protein